MIVKDKFPYYGDVKDLEPTFSGKSWGIEYKIWEWYDTIRNKRVIPALLSRCDSIIEDTYFHRIYGSMNKRTRKLHYLDDVSIVNDKCRDLYFKEYFPTGESPLQSIQKTISNKWNKEPLQVVEKFRLQKRRDTLRKDRRRRAAKFYGKPTELVSNADLFSLKRDNVI